MTRNPAGGSLINTPALTLAELKVAFCMGSSGPGERPPRCGVAMHLMRNQEGERGSGPLGSETVAYELHNACLYVDFTEQ